MSAAVKFLEKNPAGTPVDEASFDEFCGVGKSLYLVIPSPELTPGVEITLADLPEMIKSYVTSLPNPPESWSSLGPLLGGIKSSASNLKYVKTLSTSIHSRLMIDGRMLSS